MLVKCKNPSQQKATKFGNSLHLDTLKIAKDHFSECAQCIVDLIISHLNLSYDMITDNNNNNCNVRKSSEQQPHIQQLQQQQQQYSKQHIAMVKIQAIKLHLETYGLTTVNMCLGIFFIFANFFSI